MALACCSGGGMFTKAPQYRPDSKAVANEALAPKARVCQSCSRPEIQFAE